MTIASKRTIRTPNRRTAATKSNSPAVIPSAMLPKYPALSAPETTTYAPITGTRSGSGSKPPNGSDTVRPPPLGASTKLQRSYR
ncbi:putative signal peptide protein [Halorubrum sp. AJ67]|nr:putative signal peptide protein [Halorubrum sp. AJ67]